MRNFFLIVFLTITASCNDYNQDLRDNEKIPLVVITDLYHPYQDPGDNLELINAYAIPILDLKAVILDCYYPFREKIASGVSRGLIEDSNGPREPGYICVHQLNYIFNRDVPCGVGPFEQMSSKSDKMLHLSEYQNQGINLLKRVLEESDRPVTIASFGSSRALAVANNRFPDVMKKHIKMIHLSAGTSGNNPEYLEWNVALDTNAFVSLMESDLPISIYPCASGTVQTYGGILANAFMSDSNNTYYYLESLSFIEKMEPKLRQYLNFVFSRQQGVDYLAYMDKNFEMDSSIFYRSQHIWESAVWMNIADLKLVKSQVQDITIIAKNKIRPDEEIFSEKMVKCNIEVKPSGLFEYKYDPNGKYLIYQRGNVQVYQEWMNIAIPNFYKSLIIN